MHEYAGRLVEGDEGIAFKEDLEFGRRGHAAVNLKKIEMYRLTGRYDIVLPQRDALCVTCKTTFEMFENDTLINATKVGGEQGGDAIALSDAGNDDRSKNGRRR